MGQDEGGSAASAAAVEELVLVEDVGVLLAVAADEAEALRAEARKSAAEKRSRRVTDATEAF